MSTLNVARKPTHTPADVGQHKTKKVEEKGKGKGGTHSICFLGCVGVQVALGVVLSLYGGLSKAFMGRKHTRLINRRAAGGRWGGKEKVEEVGIMGEWNNIFLTRAWFSTT